MFPSVRIFAPLIRMTAIRTTLIAAVLLGDAAAGGLVVRLDDGSRLAVGEIVSIDDASLRVAATGERIRIERSVPWRRIVAAELDREPYRRDELRLAFGLTPQARPAAFAGYGCPPPVPVCVPCGPVFVSPGRVVGVRPDPLGSPGGFLP